MTRNTPTPAVTAGTERLMTKTDVARLLGLSTRTVQSLVRRGDLIPTRIGRLVRFTPAAVQAFIHSNTEGR